jgi:LPXTG-site transpeptidase (sortase) family protein
VKNLRQRFLVGLGAAMFALGAVILSFGLIAYFDQNDGGPAKASGLLSAQNLEYMPAVPYDPPMVPTPTPTPEPVARPVRMVIEKLGVDAPVVEMGLDDQGIPRVPLNGQDVVWYNFSSPPGAGSNAVFAGHINWEGAPGSFGGLSQLGAKDKIRLISEDGHEYTYEVTANFAVDPTASDSLEVMAPTDKDIVTLITCGGTWVPDSSERFGGSYTNRTIVQAQLVKSTLGVPGSGAASAG